MKAILCHYSLIKLLKAGQIIGDGQMSEERFQSHKEFEMSLRKITIWGYDGHQSSVSKVKAFLPDKLMF